MGYINLISVTIAAGQDFDLPEGFLFASINPSADASYVITNSNNDSTNAISTVFSFPSLGNVSLQGYAEHNIAATGGEVEVVYVTGN